MPSDKLPSNEPKNNKKHLSLEEIKKLKVGDTVWTYDDALRGQRLDIAPMTIVYLDKGVIKFKILGKRYDNDLRFIIKEFSNNYRIFRTQEDAQKALKREARFN